MTLDKGNISKLNYHNDFLDYIYTVNTVYFWEDLNQGYSEIYRVLKKAEPLQMSSIQKNG